MAFSSNSGGGPMADINVTPMVDVMLVLLIIFMITAPMLTHRVTIDLPQPNPNVTPPKNPPEPIRLRVAADGTLYWNGQAISAVELQAQLAVSAQRSPQPELQVQAADNTQYQDVALVLSDAKSAGMAKIGFLNIDQQ